MKINFRVLSFALLFLSLNCGPSFAQAQGKNGNFGLGFSIGSQSAITAKNLLGSNTAIDGGLAFGSDWNFIYADHLWEYPGFLNGRGAAELKNLTGYIGVGGGLATWSTGKSCGRFSCSDKTSGTAIFARVPFGVSYMLNQPSFEFYGELVPTINIVPATTSNIDAALGFRFYF